MSAVVEHVIDEGHRNCARQFDRNFSVVLASEDLGIDLRLDSLSH